MTSFEQYPLGPRPEQGGSPTASDGPETPRWVVAVVRPGDEGTEFLEPESGTFSREDVVGVINRIEARDDATYPLDGDVTLVRISDVELLAVEQGLFGVGRTLRFVAGRLA